MLSMRKIDLIRKYKFDLDMPVKVMGRSLSYKRYRHISTIKLIHAKRLEIKPFSRFQY